MVILAFAASLILTSVFYYWKRRIEDRGGKVFWHIFFEKSLEFLIPFTVIAGLFLLLSLFVGGTSHLWTIERLRQFEKALAAIAAYAAEFKLSALLTGIILLALYFIGLLPMLSKYKIADSVLPYLKKYKTAVRWVYTILVLLFSFTFFGVQSEKPAAELRFRIEENEKLYGELRDEVEEALRKEVADKLYLKIYHVSFDRTYRIDMDRGDDGPPQPPPPPPPPPPSGPPGGDDPVDDGGGDDKGPIVYNLFNDPDSDVKAPDPTPSPTPGSPSAPPVPEHASIGKTSRALVALARLRNAIQRPFIRLFATEAGREIGLQPAKMFSSKIKKEALDVLTADNPLAGALVAKLVEMFDKNVEPLVLKGIERATSAAARNPERARQIITIEANSVVASTEVGLRPFITAVIQKARDSIARQWYNITRLPARPVKQSAEEAARIDYQIGQLTCPSEENRLRAAAYLARVAARLNESQVARIKEGLGEKMQKLLRFKISPTHEGMFVEVKVKYYAALALEGMHTNHLLSVDRVAAAEIVYEVESNPPAKLYTWEEVEERMRA